MQHTDNLVRLPNENTSVDGGHRTALALCVVKLPSTIPLRPVKQLWRADTFSVRGRSSLYSCR